MTPFEVDLLDLRMKEKNQVLYFQLTTVITAMQALAQAIVSGEASFTKTNDSLRIVKDLLFPELREEVEDKMEKTRVIMEKELAKGPLKVQALDYGKKRKKRK